MKYTIDDIKKISDNYYQNVFLVSYTSKDDIEYEIVCKTIEELIQFLITFYNKGHIGEVSISVIKKYNNKLIVK